MLTAQARHRRIGRVVRRAPTYDEGLLMLKREWDLQISDLLAQHQSSPPETSAGARRRQLLDHGRGPKTRGRR